MSTVATPSGFFRTVNPKTASFCLAMVAALSLVGGLACASRSLAMARAGSAPVLATLDGDHAPAISGRSAHKLTRSPVRALGNPSLRPAEARTAAVGA